jgi:hypothetical protein
MQSFSEYLSESSKEVTFVFGRFNPPTEGHELLFEKLKKLARGGVYRIYASKSVDSKKNPLPFKDKIKFMRKMFPKHARNIMADKDVRTVLDIATKLYDQGFTKITMVAGSDRVREFEILLNKYNGKKSKHGLYNFEEGIRVLSAGKRDPDSDDVKGMSASKLRAFAAAGDLQGFADNSLEVPGEGIQTLYYAVRKGLGLKKESFRKHVELPPLSETREDYIDGSLYKVGDVVKIKESNELGEIVICGSNYVMVQTESDKKRHWLDAVEIAEEGGAGEWGTDKLTNNYKRMTPGQFFKEKMGPQDPDIKKMKGTQPKGYYAKDADGDEMSKSTKKKRAAHFKKLSTKPAPGDATAKTKPSDHTKKYKQMFGELYVEDYKVTEGNSDAALKKKADASKMPLAILRKVFDRGVAAWKSGHRPGTTAVQWGLARVNSFVTKGKGTWGKADKDLAAKV